MSASSVPSSPDITALTRALAQEDAEAGLRAALEILAHLGVVPQAPAPQAEPWLAWDDDGPSPKALFVTAAAPCEQTRELIEGVIAGLRARVRDRDALRSTQERLEMLSEASFEGLFVHVDGVLVDANARVAELFGMTRQEVLAAGSLPNCVAPEDLPRVRSLMASGYEGSYVISAVRKDGSRFKAEIQAKQGRIGGRPVRVVALRDVSEREHQASLLRESEARLRGLAESAFDMFVLSVDGTVIEIGGDHERLLGYKREELVGKHVTDLVAPADRGLALEVIAQRRTTPYELLLVAKDETLLPVQVVGAYVPHQGKPARLAGVRDLRADKRKQAERRKLERRVERSQRLEALGVLTGGIAHDFNNLLLGIIGNAELLALSDQSVENMQAIAAIRVASERAGDLIRQMLAYAGQRHVTASEPVDIGDLLRELRSLLEVSLSKRAELRLEIAARSVVIGDRTTLSQVLISLLTNASDALQGGPGSIELEVRPESIPDARWDDALGAPVGPGEWILVRVRDTGIGMDAATRARIFEPFFTTKESGHGLGLAACLGIVKAHRGAILVESTPGVGSCFSLLLPAARVEPKREPDSPTVQPCRVLVIDDEPLVRRQLARLLSLHGFHVDVAEDGRAGLELFETVQPELVIVDRKMPGLDGVEVARRIRERDRTVSILLTSGYYDADSEPSLQDGTIQGFLPKPYDTRTLLQSIAAAREKPALHARQP